MIRTFMMFVGLAALLLSGFSAKARAQSGSLMENTVEFHVLPEARFWSEEISYPVARPRMEERRSGGGVVAGSILGALAGVAVVTTSSFMQD